MLDSLPLPKSPKGILSAIVLMIISFVLYYAVGFPAFLQAYDHQFQNVPFIEGDCKGLNTYMRIPKWVYSNGVQWVYVSIENNSGMEIKNVTVQFFVPSGKPRNNFYLLPAFFEDNLFNDLIHTDALQDGVVLSGRLLVPTRDGFKMTDTKLRVTCDNQSGFKRPAPEIAINANQLGAFLHSTLENILLPPWANGIIPAFVLLSCWYFEGDEINRREKIKVSEVLIIVVKGLGFNLILWFIFGLGVQSPGWFWLVAVPTIITLFLLYVFEKK